MKRIFLTCIGACALALPAVAADVPVKAPVVKAPVSAPVFNWTGFYVGGTAGYGWGESRHCEGGACTFNFDVDGFVGGGTIGLNYQWANWVVGLEADLSHADVAGSTTGVGSPFGCGATLNCSTELSWLATGRVRAGAAFDRIFAYVTAGVAKGRLHAASGPIAAFSGEVTKSGRVVGVGVEYAFAPNWSAKIEYLRVDLGSFNFATPPTFSAEEGKFSLVRAGVNYRFATR